MLFQVKCTHSRTDCTFISRVLRLLFVYPSAFSPCISPLIATQLNVLQQSCEDACKGKNALFLATTANSPLRFIAGSRSFLPTSTSRLISLDLLETVEIPDANGRRGCCHATQRSAISFGSFRFGFIVLATILWHDIQFPRCLVEIDVSRSRKAFINPSRNARNTHAETLAVEIFAKASRIAVY